MNIKNKTEEFESAIEQNLGVIDDRVRAIKDSRAKPTDMSREEYVWLLFSRSISLQIKDIILLINTHKDAVERPYAAVYSVFRSILEEYFHLKLLFADMGMLHTHFLALMLVDNRKNKKHLITLQGLSGRNMFILSNDPKIIISADGLRRKIIEYEVDIDKVKQDRGANEITRLSNIYNNLEQVCIEYDKVKNISSVEDGKEGNSLVWQYHYIYRFLCGSVHGLLGHKEVVLNILWPDSSKVKRDDYLEVLNSANSILSEIIEMTPQKL